MNYYDILLAKKLEDDRDPQVVGLSVTENGTYAEEGKVYKPVVVNVEGYKIADVSGLPASIATFTDGSALPMPKLEVAVEPQQEGSGDPSPTNIRPIIGWSAVDVSVEDGQNLYNDGIVWKNNYYINASGAETQSNNYKYTQTFIEVEPSTTYSIQADITAPTDLAITVPYYSNTQAFLSRDLVASVNIGTHTYKADFTTPSNCKYIRISVPTDTTNIIIYKKNIYTINLNGTRYGGKLRIVNGVAEFVADRGIVDLGNLTYTYDAVYNRFASSTITNLKKVDVRTLFMTSTCYRCMWHNESVSDIPDYSFYNSNAESNIYIHDSRYTDATALKTALAGQTVCYPLDTPTIIPLGEVAISSFLGVNNIWADTGDVVDGQYFKSL